MIEKNQMLSLRCLRLGSDLEGVCEHEGMAVFVPGALPGETIQAQVLKVFPRYAFARLRETEKPSPTRTAPPCPVYELCGGCGGQHMTYAATLEAKRSQVWDCLTRVGGLRLEPGDVPPPLGAENPWRCRNKTALPVGGTPDEPQIGFYRRRSHQIVPLTDCPVSMVDLTPVVVAVKEWMGEARVAPYCEETGKGLLRHVIVRASRSGQVMVLLAAAQAKLPGIALLTDKLRERVKGFCALHLTVNRARNNVILGESSQKLWGADIITETLLGLTFEISPLSFFQVNPAQTERLYQTALAFAQLKPGDTVVDAYAGAGTITLCAAGRAKKAIGIEIVPQAVESALRNAERNAVTNAAFYTDAVERRLPRLIAEGLRPDVVFLDPPRKGVEPEVIRAVLEARPRRVVYVSCHAPTQARDVKLLAEGGYQFEACQPVDMFCWAAGVENVLSMTLKEGNEG